MRPVRLRAVCVSAPQPQTRRQEMDAISLLSIMSEHQRRWQGRLLPAAAQSSAASTEGTCANMWFFRGKSEDIV